MEEKKINPNPDQEKINEVIQGAIASRDIPKIYCNGFTVAIGNADVLVVLQNNQQPVAVLNLSFSIAKTLVQKLNGLIGTIETASGNTIMTTDDLSGFLTNK